MLNNPTNTTNLKLYRSMISHVYIIAFSIPLTMTNQSKFITKLAIKTIKFVDVCLHKI